jgi:hypothetical protein
MPRIVGAGSSRLVLALLVALLLFAFTPIERALMSGVDGSFTPTPYTALALERPSTVAAGGFVGKSVPIELTNRTGHVKTYHWSATQDGALIALGVKTVENGRSTVIYVPSTSAVTGRMRVALIGTDIFLTVPIRKT